MRGFLLKTYIWLVISFLSSCNYEPEGILITNLEPPSLNGITINLNDYEGNQILLKDRTTFTYIVSTSGKKIISTKVYFNSQVIWASSQPTSSFDLDPTPLNTGSYNLRIVAELATGSGSLAEKMEAESIIVLLDKSVIVDKVIPEDPGDPAAIAILSIENTENTVKVTWNKYDKFNFQQYQITREDFDEQGVAVSSINFPAITASSQNFLYDYTYLGGKTKYYVTLKAANSTYRSPGVSYEHPFKPALFTEIGAQGEVTIKWSSIAALKSNFSKYKLDIIDESGGIFQTTTFEKLVAEDTVVTTTIPNFRLGKFLKLKLSIYSSVSSYVPKIVNGNLNYGDRFPKFITVPTPKFDPTTNSYYFRIYFIASNTDPKLNKISATGIKLDSLDRSYQYFAVAQGAPIAVGTVNNKTYLIDLEKMEEVKTIEIPVNTVYGISKDAKILAFNSDEGVKVYSSEGQSLLTLGFIGDQFHSISTDGKYVTGSDKIYKFNGTNYELWTFFTAYGYNSISYLNHDPDRMVISYPNRVVLFNLATKTVEQTNTNYIGPCNYDPVSKKIGCRGANTFVVLNPEDLSLYKSIEVNPNNEYFLLNETIICSGAQIKLSDLP